MLGTLDCPTEELEITDCVLVIGVSIELTLNDGARPFRLGSLFIGRAPSLFISIGGAWPYDFRDEPNIKVTKISTQMQTYMIRPHWVMLRFVLPQVQHY